MKTVKKRKSNAGFTLVELMVASIILLTAVLAGALMMIIGVSRNGANRVDTTATNAAQTVLEQIASLSANVSTTLPLTDCTGKTLSINTANGGAPLTSSGNIDFTQAAVAGYQMNYTVCGTNGIQVVYDVRWNISGVQTSGYGKVVTVSARQPFVAGTTGMSQLTPVTLRTVAGI